MLHVIERPAEGTKLDSERLEERIKKALSELVSHRGSHLDVRYRVEFGNIPAAILKVATEIDSDFIVLGVRRSSGVLDRFMWPIAYELVRTATCPVLTIHGSGPTR